MKKKAQRLPQMDRTRPAHQTYLSFTIALTHPGKGGGIRANQASPAMPSMSLT